MSTVTSPIMTDATGQDIADALLALINAVKPDASDIPYDSNLSVKGKIDEVVDDVNLKLDVIIKSSGSINDITDTAIHYVFNAVTDKPVNDGGLFLTIFGRENTGVGLYISYRSELAVYRANYVDGAWIFYEIQETLSKGGFSSPNFNNITTSGYYWFNLNDATNSPYSNPSGKFGVLTVKKPSTAIILQEFTRFLSNYSSTENGETYIRFYANGQWYGWRKVY